MVDHCHLAWNALGQINSGREPSKIANLRFRRSIYPVADISEDETLSPDNLRIIRPGFGLAPKYMKDFLGREVRQKFKRGTALTWELESTGP